MPVSFSDGVMRSLIPSTIPTLKIKASYEKAGFQPVRTFIRKTDSGQHEFLQMAKKESL
jgi:hypothetical protein